MFEKMNIFKKKEGGMKNEKDIIDAIEEGQLGSVQEIDQETGEKLGLFTENQEKRDKFAKKAKEYSDKWKNDKIAA